MIKKFFLSVLLTLTIIPFASAQSPDWVAIAKSIVDEEDSDYDKFYSIYEWICENIAYDTEYLVKTAEECYKQKKGVCQGYCDLFCRISEGAGLKARTITGRAKDRFGHLELGGHGWIYAYLDSDTGEGILIEPTWGAGALLSGKFERSKRHEFWFDVDPHWMIFRHFPENEEDQFLEQPLTDHQWVFEIGGCEPVMQVFGVDPEEVIKKRLAGEKVIMPEFYKTAFERHDIKGGEIPMTDKLYVGEEITVRIECAADKKLLILGTASNPDFNYGTWYRDGNYTVGVYTPHYPGTAHIGIKDEDGKYGTLALYKVVEKPAE